MKYVLYIILFFPLQSFSLTVHVTDGQNDPVPSCLVQIGMAPQNPFQANSSVSDPNGLVEFQTAPITSQPITLLCPNRAIVTYLQQTGDLFNLKVDDIIDPQITEVAGKFVGWKDVGQNGNLDFALMVPSIEALKVFNIQWPDLVSQRMDDMSVWGQKFKIPSNINIPKQKIRYGLLSATLQKENTAFTIEGTKKKSFMSLSGKFQASQLIQAYLDGEKDYLKFLNMMDFYSVGLSKATTSNSSTELDANQIKLKNCMSLKASVTLPGLQTIGVAASNNNLSTDLQISDIKLLSSSSQIVKCPDKNSKLPLITALATDTKAKSTSQVVIRSPASLSIDFRSFMTPPQIKINNEKSIEFTRAENNSLSFTASGFKATLYDLYNTAVIAKAAPQWIVFSPSTLLSVEKIDLPQLPEFFNNYTVNAPTNKHRWEVMWLGIDPTIETAGSSQNVDFNFFGVATHASKNSTDF